MQTQTDDHLRRALAQAGADSFMEIVGPVAEANLSLTFWTYARGACNTAEFYRRVGQLEKIAEFDPKLIITKKTEIVGRFPVTWNVTDKTGFSKDEIEVSFPLPFLAWFTWAGLEYWKTKKFIITFRSLLICAIIGALLTALRFCSASLTDIVKRKAIAREMLSQAEQLGAILGNPTYTSATEMSPAPSYGLSNFEIAGLVVPATLAGAFIAATAGLVDGILAYAVFLLVGYIICHVRKRHCA